MRILRGRPPGARAEKRPATFSGEVWVDTLLTSPDGVAVNDVSFSPGGRTHWHSHERGQVLRITAGEGWVGQRGEAPERVRAGDVVWAAPDEEHWHGASDETFLVHLAVSMGQTRWLEEVEAAHQEWDLAQEGQPG